MFIQSLAGRSPVYKIKKGKKATFIELMGRPKTKKKATKKTPVQVGLTMKPVVQTVGRRKSKPASLPISRAKKTIHKSRGVRAGSKSLAVTNAGPLKVVRVRPKSGTAMLLQGKTGKLMGNFVPSIRNFVGSAKPVVIGVGGALAGAWGISFAQRYVPMSNNTKNITGLVIGMGLPFVVRRPEAKIAGFGLAVISGMNLFMDNLAPRIGLNFENKPTTLNGVTEFEEPVLTRDNVSDGIALNGATGFGAAPLNGATGFGAAPLNGATGFGAAPLNGSYEQPFVRGYRIEDEGM